VLIIMFIYIVYSSLLKLFGWGIMYCGANKMRGCCSLIGGFDWIVCLLFRRCLVDWEIVYFICLTFHY